MNDEALHAVLAELPVFTPDAGLWPRIAAAHEKNRPPRRPRGWQWMAIAAAAAVAFAGILTVPRAPTGTLAVEGQRESQRLEREWQALAAAPAGIRPAASIARLHVIDAALQAAYDRGARADELAPLWKQRNEALRGLILTAQAETVTRI
jgi:hypothetical protein